MKPSANALPSWGLWLAASLTAILSSGASAVPAFNFPTSLPSGAQTGNPVYTENPLTSTFTSTVAPGGYAQFIGGGSGTAIIPGYTPNTGNLLGGGAPRVDNTGNPYTLTTPPFEPVVVQFNTAVSQILVFPALDHLRAVGNGTGSFKWDAYQYSIYGGTLNTMTGAVDFTLLFDPRTALGTDDPTGLTDPNFILDTWYGIGPTLVNNAITGPNGGFAGLFGYEAYFAFGASYAYYGFAASTLVGALNPAERGAEFFAVANAAAVPEPATLALLGIGLIGLGLSRPKSWFGPDPSQCC